MSDHCYLCEESCDDEFSCCYTCLKYRNMTRNICLVCEKDGLAFFPSRFGHNIGSDGSGYSDHLICCSEKCCAQFNFRDILYPRVFAFGKLSLSLKWLKQSNYERDYWVTLMPILCYANRFDYGQHPVWSFLYQERHALLLPLLPTLVSSLPPDAPYKRRDHSIKTKFKEPVVLISETSEKALASWNPYNNPNLPYSNEKKKFIMGLRDYIHKFVGDWKRAGQLHVV